AVNASDTARPLGGNVPRPPEARRWPRTRAILRCVARDHRDEWPHANLFRQFALAASHSTRQIGCSRKSSTRSIGRSTLSLESCRPRREAPLLVLLSTP